MMLYGKGEIVHFKKRNTMNSVATDGKSFLRLTDATEKIIFCRTELEVRIVEQAKEEISKFPGLYELVFKITALTEVIVSGINGSHY